MLGWEGYGARKLLHVTPILDEPEIEAVLEVEVKKEFGLDAEKV